MIFDAVTQQRAVRAALLGEFVVDVVDVDVLVRVGREERGAAVSHGEAAREGRERVDERKDCSKNEPCPK